ncbi:MAG: RNA polymerase recycling motor HelD [Sporolactobacillus sp.]
MDDRQREQLRVAAVMKMINRRLNVLTDQKGGVTEGIVELRKNFWEDVTVNFDEADDIYETQASIKQQAELLSERERRHGQMSRAYRLLLRLRDVPYFGRIDFKATAEKQVLPVYIGTGSLMDDKDEQFLIYDWRAPIASMYYDFAPGEDAHYETVDGTVSGTITLKRQYIIRGGQLEGMFDTGVTIGDMLLRKMLGNKASLHMKSIVATIQKEQNQVIRDEQTRYLIVQGAAGSGKTSAALQRAAFLLYRNRKTLHTDNMLLFSPNPLFSHFIAAVLPELGEENVVQTTYHDFIRRRMGSFLQMESPFTQTETHLREPDEEVSALYRETIRFKASTAFGQLIDNWLEQLKSEGMAFRSITFRGQTIVSAQTIAKRFYAGGTQRALTDRLEDMRDWLLRRIAVFAKKERGADWVLEETELLESSDYASTFEQLQAKKQFSEETFDDYAREEEWLRRIVVNRRIKPLRRRIKMLAFVNTEKIYSELFYMAHARDSLPAHWQQICLSTRRRFEEGDCPWEDATPYLYLKEKICGRAADSHMRHLIIDEAQDYSPMQLTYLRFAFPKCNMTVLGDSNQAVLAQSFGQETMLSETLYDRKDMKKLDLQRSYRATQEIVEFSRSFVPGGEAIQPFARSGPLPELIETVPERKLLFLSERVSDCRSRGLQSIALIGKTMTACIKLYGQLSPHLNMQLITDETAQYDQGVVLIPAYLAKGIEFDAVIVFDATADSYARDYERTIFYTACTRAMHELTLLADAQPSPFMNDVSADKYVCRVYK